MRRNMVSFVVLFLVSSFTFADSPRAGGPFQLPGLNAAASITRDIYGIAHIRANNEHDLFFLQGYTHAQDRLFQMDVSRRRASGTLAELLGPKALASDVELRTIGLRRAAERSLAVFSNRTLEALDAYTEGVNAYVASHPLPPEYGGLELTQFGSWTALDSVTIAKLVSFGLSFDLGDIGRTDALFSYKAAGEQLGFNGTALFFEDLFRAAPFDPAATVPDASTAPPAVLGVQAAGARTEKMDRGTMTLGKRYLKRLRKIPYLRPFVEREDPPGSNEWAASGEHTVTGFPLLANDPHLALGMPSTFYPVHLKAKKLDVFGSGFAGVPFVIVGHNRYVAWGAAVNPLDATDVFQEQIVPDPSSPSGLSSVYMGRNEPIIPIPEIFRVNQVRNGVLDNLMVVPPGGVPAATLIIPRRNNGPIIGLNVGAGTALSIQYTGFSATRELDTFMKWNVARGLDDFIDGLQFLDFGSVSLAYADREGTIAYFTSGELPIREDLQMNIVNGLPPFFIRNGTGGNEWLPVQNPQPGQAIPFEILPFSEMPQIINPPVGWLVNANNDPAGVTLDNNALNQLRPGGGIFYLNPAFDLGIRAGRITTLLEQKLTSDDRKISFEEMQEIQADVVLGDAQVFVPVITSALESAQSGSAHPMLAELAAYPGVAEAVGRLAAWDFSTPTGIPEGYDASDVDGMLTEPSAEEKSASVAASIYSVWRGQFINNTIDTTLQGLGGLPAPGSREIMKALRNLLDNFDVNQGVGASGVNFFNVPGVLDANIRRDIIVLQSIRDALDLMAGDAFAAAFGNSANQGDYRWGRLHRIVFEHPLGAPFSIPPAGPAFPAPPGGLTGIPTDGGFETVDASRHDVRADEPDEFMFDRGPVNRIVAEMNRHGVRAESVWPGGTSGVLGDEYYANLLPLWLTNDSVQLLTRNNEIVKNAASVAKFVPAR